jgi:hypothetical protein
MKNAIKKLTKEKVNLMIENENLKSQVKRMKKEIEINLDKGYWYI